MKKREARCPNQLLILGHQHRALEKNPDSYLNHVSGLCNEHKHTKIIKIS